LPASTAVKRFKGSEIASIDPDTGQVTALFHPRIDQWIEQFELRKGEIQAVTAKGQATVRLLRMNRAGRIRERQMLLD